MILFYVLLILIGVYWYGVRNFNYWKKRGVKHDKTIPYFGTNLDQYLQKASMAMLATRTYRMFPQEKVVGFYRASQPELVIRDLDIAKRILITDFNHFHKRGLNPHDSAVEPMLRNLFFLDGDAWRLLRQRISPTFSSGKLKGMFPIITDRAEKLQVITEKIHEKGEIFDARDLMARYTTDFIGACGFGLNMDALSDKESQFRKLGKRIFVRTPYDALRALLKEMFPELCKNVPYLTPEIEKSMIHLVNAVIKERNFKPCGKNDFVDLMLELKQMGEMVGESLEKRNPDGTPEIVKIELDDLLMAAQIFVFFGAGFETSSSASSYTLHQFAYHPECQKKAQDEIDKVLKKYDNKITYDAVKEMTYLEMAFLEGMRMYPSVGYLIRRCASPEYNFPDLGFSIHKGVRVVIPIQAIHNDEKYFENPEEFNPERFHPDLKKDLKKFIYLPFGEGPRSCVGARLGQMQSMAGIVALLQKYTVEPSPISVKKPLPDPTATVAEGILGGLPLLLRKRVL